MPVLIPHNPLSLLSIAISYLIQSVRSPKQNLYSAYFSPSTCSVHVTDQETIRCLWEMGFFGRGSLSRSEPNWLDSQRKKGETSEEATGRRRAERRDVKLARARKEQEAISQRLDEEKENSEPLLPQDSVISTAEPRTPFRDIANVLDGVVSDEQLDPVKNDSNGSIAGYEEWRKTVDHNGLPTPPPTTLSSETDLQHVDSKPKLQKRKTVTFSPTIEAREFDLSSPTVAPIKDPGSVPRSAPIMKQLSTPKTENQEHLQLSLEEAFFLSYGLGVLQIYSEDTCSDALIPSTSLLTLFRRHSYFPPRTITVPNEPDDPFLLSYAVYHHYRSLGWVVRSGVKFSVDFLLYNRGPAFSHAEFAIVILPSYSHSYWSETEQRQKAVAKKTSKTWWWLHGINRVQSQVRKSLMLCYVDIPPPASEHKREEHADIGQLFGRYKIRDINVKRWTPNRSRD